MRMESQSTAHVAAVIAVLFLLALPPCLLAQDRGTSRASVTGVVEDGDRGSGISSATVRLVRQAEDSTFTGPASETTAGNGGRFTVDGLEPGTYQLRVQALGYEELEDEIEVQGQSHIRVGLVPDAIELDPVVVVTRRSRYLQDVGFYQRRETGRSRSTFTRDEIGSFPGNMISDLLRTLPGVTIRSGGISTPTVLFRAGCRPDVVVDGINLGTNVQVDDMVRPGDVEGLEVHRGATTLLPFSNSSCGSLVVWTIDPSAREGGKPWTWWRLGAAAGISAVMFLIMR